MSIVVFDVFFEKYFGFNTLGFKSLNSTRIISFFYDESIVGSFLFCFGLLVVLIFCRKIIIQLEIKPYSTFLFF